MSDSKLQLLLRAFMAGAFVVGACIGLAVVDIVEQQFFDVNVDWTVTERRNVGPDVIVSGTMRKVRACEYIAPVRARTQDGVHLVVTSDSPTSGQTWAPSDTPQQFGPWRIHNGAGSRIEVYQVHRCHPLWLTFSQLGELAP